MQSKFEVWGMLRVADRSVTEIHNFFRSEYGVCPDYLLANLHLTIYHCRRPMFDLKEEARRCNLSVDTYDTRFMVLAPGGENPRPELVPSEHKVGIRIMKSSHIRKKIDVYRQELLLYESGKVLGRRKASSRSNSAFGARYYQPHIAILRAGSPIISNLYEVGDNFREFVSEIHFDRFIIRKRQNF